MIRRRSAVTAIFLLVFLSGCRSGNSPSSAESWPPHAAAGSGGIVVSEDSIATSVGIEILRSGGNAVDAAVAVALTLAVTFPEAGNLGGGGFMVVYDPVAEDLWGLDFRETAPAAAYREMYEELARKGVTDGSTFGPLAAGIPGSPAGLHEAWKRGGSLAWTELVAPAIRLSRDGFLVGERLHEGIARKVDDLRRHPSTSRIFLPGGRVPEPGDLFVQEDLSQVLEALATGGSESFYKGQVARTVVAGVRRAGGIWALDDLSTYNAVFRSPVRISLHDGPSRSGADRRPVHIVTMPPPSSGAAVFAQALSLLRRRSALHLAHDDPAGAIAWIEVMRLVFADRNSHLADPAHMTTSLEDLTDEAYLATRAALLPEIPPGDSRRVSGGKPAAESKNTTHVVVIDERGTAVSLSTTLNSLFGGKWVAPGTGVLLNNEMDDFDTRPGEPNIYGLVGTGVNAVYPGARMLSSMSPTIVLRGEEVWFALGARGGPHILTAVLQVILNRWRDGMNLVEAVEAPRLHHQWWPDKVFVEEGRVIGSVLAAVEKTGYEIATEPFIGRVMAAERLPGGRFLGVVDSRTTGKVMTVED